MLLDLVRRYLQCWILCYQTPCFGTRSGIERTKGCFLVPVATGLALALCLLSLKHTRPEAKYVVMDIFDWLSKYGTGM